MGHSYRIADNDPKNGEDVCGDLAVCFYSNTPFMSKIQTEGISLLRSWYHKSVPGMRQTACWHSHAFSQYYGVRAA